MPLVTCATVLYNFEVVIKKQAKTERIINSNMNINQDLSKGGVNFKFFLKNLCLDCANIC